MTFIPIFIYTSYFAPGFFPVLFFIIIATTYRLYRFYHPHQILMVPVLLNENGLIYQGVIDIIQPSGKWLRSLYYFNLNLRVKKIVIIWNLMSYWV